MAFITVLCAGFLSVPPVHAQSSTTIAVLDFKSGGNLQKEAGKYAAEKLRSTMSARDNLVVLDQWLIDTMASAQGSLQLLQCREESCLLAIGHLLVADVVVNGTVERLNDKYMISVIPVDIKNNRAMPVINYTVRDLKNTTLAETFSTVADRVLAGIGTGNDTLAENTAAASTQKKPGIMKKILIGTLAVAVIGGAAGGGYYYKSRKDRGGSTGTETPDGTKTVEIPLTDLPKHPE